MIFESHLKFPKLIVSLNCMCSKLATVQVFPAMQVVANDVPGSNSFAKSTAVHENLFKIILFCYYFGLRDVGWGLNAVKCRN